MMMKLLLGWTIVVIVWLPIVRAACDDFLTGVNVSVWGIPYCENADFFHDSSSWSIVNVQQPRLSLQQQRLSNQQQQQQRRRRPHRSIAPRHRRRLDDTIGGGFVPFCETSLIPTDESNFQLDPNNMRIQATVQGYDETTTEVANQGTLLLAVGQLTIVNNDDEYLLVYIWPGQVRVDDTIGSSGGSSFTRNHSLTTIMTADTVWTAELILFPSGLIRLDLKKNIVDDDDASPQEEEMIEIAAASDETATFVQNIAAAGQVAIAVDGLFDHHVFAVDKVCVSDGDPPSNECGEETCAGPTLPQGGKHG